MKQTLIYWMEEYSGLILMHGLRILLIIGASYIIHKIIKKFIAKTIRMIIVKDESDNEDGEIKREDTLISIFSTTALIAIFTISGLMILQQLGVHIGPLLAGAGIVGLALGFGGQYLIRDIISGLFIIIESQYRIGDVVKFNDVGGRVERITLRLTTLRDLDGVVHHIPHGEITKVSNFSKVFSRVNLNIGIAYNSDLDKAIEVINKTGLEMAEDPQWKDAFLKPLQFLRVDDLADSAIVMKILGETVPDRQWEVAGEFRKRIKKAFDMAGIEIPFPQVVMHNPAKS